MEKVLIKCTINGDNVENYVDPRASLTDMLRGDYSLKSVKKGCEVGECGACTVLVDSETVNSCIYLAVWADGKSIRTLEGLQTAEGGLTALQQYFIDEGAVQCGFCTPGFLMSATAIMESGHQPDRAEIRRALSGNLCRCTGYENIVTAVEKALAKK